MSMNELFGLAGAKPKLITRYTSAAPTGTYVPTVDNARCLVRIQGGGGGGWSAAGSGGGGGAMVEVFIRIPIAGLAYIVGAGGTVTVNGSDSKLGNYIAQGGRCPTGSIAPGLGGFLGNMAGSVDADSAAFTASNPLPGVAGGGGGYNTSTHGQVAGYPIPINSVLSTGSMYVYATSNGQGLGGGGNSFFGLGGAPGSSAGATEYGAGGGSQGSGCAGLIEIWDFGA